METLSHKFVDAVPETLEPGIIYISMRRRIAVHLCPCGCGNEVPTPISPTDWQITYDGDSISLSPSIGNWEFACRSHYWITNNRVKHAASWDNWRVERGRTRDEYRKRAYYDAPPMPAIEEARAKTKPGNPKSLFGRAKSFFYFLVKSIKAPKGGIKHGQSNS